MPRFNTTVVLATLLVAALAGNAQTEPDGQAMASTQGSAPALVIGSGDLVSVSIFDDPELSGRFRVDHKGDVEMPLLDAVHVAGLTAGQAAKLINDQYVKADILIPERARSTVFIEEYANQGITVSGEVKNPGIYPAFGVRMLNDVITAAGGANPTASSKVLITRRSDPRNPVSVAYNPAATSSDTPEAQIFPGDTVTVPRAGIVYVMGAVNKPGGFVLNGRVEMSVQKAVALAGGTGRAPSMHKVQVVRNTDDGTKLMISVDLARILKGTAPDMLLRNGDILYVPTSTGKIATQVAITAAVAVGSGILIYKIAYH